MPTPLLSHWATQILGINLTRALTAHLLRAFDSARLTCLHAVKNGSVVVRKTAGLVIDNITGVLKFLLLYRVHTTHD